MVDLPPCFTSFAKLNRKIKKLIVDDNYHQPYTYNANTRARIAISAHLFGDCSLEINLLIK